MRLSNALFLYKIASPRQNFHLWIWTYNFQTTMEYIDNLWQADVYGQDLSNAIV